MQKSSFFNTLLGRLLLLGLVPAILAIVAIVTLSAVDGYRAALRTQIRILETNADSAASELSVRNDRWNSTAQTLAASQVDGLFGRRKETVAFLKTVNAISSLNLSMYVVYEPNADGQDSQSLKSGEIPSESMDATGRFVPVWFDEYQTGVRTGESKLKPSVGMDKLDYYIRPKEEFAKTGKAVPIITEPYSKEGQTIVSHVFPIVIKGKFVGVAGVNRSLDVLTGIASAIKSLSHADVFILSPGGEFIAATTDTGKNGEDRYRGRAIGQTPFAAHAARWQQVDAAGDAGAFEMRDPVLGEDCIYSNARAEIGGWTIVTRRAKSDVMRDANVSLLRNLLLGAAGIVLVGGLMFAVIRRVSGRVRLAAESADRIARGDLTQPIAQSAAADESGQLMRSMNAMDSNLNALVGSVKQAGIRLSSTATEIAATAKHQEASASTFGAASNQIAAAVKEISATGQDLVRTMDSVSAIAVETADLAGAGRAGLKGMESVMHDLDRATGSIAEKLSTINERSQRITTVITTITKVADQTNILSINAAIEAEKAGEYGAGFLVIAREIRRLADQTAAATLDIEQMVQQMQGAVSTGVMEMDRFADQVRRGVGQVASAGSQLTEIIDRVNRSTGSFKQVNESMLAQSEGAQQISEAMASLVANANQTMQSVQEFGRAASDLQAAIGLLRQAVAQFKLRES